MKISFKSFAGGCIDVAVAELMWRCVIPGVLLQQWSVTTKIVRDCAHGVSLDVECAKRQPETDATLKLLWASGDT